MWLYFLDWRSLRAILSPYSQPIPETDSFDRHQESRSKFEMMIKDILVFTVVTVRLPHKVSLTANTRYLWHWNVFQKIEVVGYSCNANLVGSCVQTPSLPTYRFLDGETVSDELLLKYQICSAKKSVSFWTALPRWLIAFLVSVSSSAKVCSKSSGRKTGS